MQLTVNAIEDVLRTGKAENTPLADRFIDEVREKYGIHIAACYFFSGEVLSLYIHSQKSRSHADQAGIKEDIFHTLMDAAQTEPASRKKHSVHVDYIDQLALWNYLTDSLPALNRCALIREAGARVLCGWDASRNAMAYFVIVPSADSVGSLKQDFADYAFRLIKPKDLWDAVTLRAVTPVVTEWAALTQEQRFALCRG
ncbi:MAG: hypothetical protein IJ493_12785 [Clostridia bacterium]|nr:hypothetical protein [Clostridia bacterium]